MNDVEFFFYVYRRSVEDSLQQYCFEKSRYSNQSSPLKMASNDMYDPNQNKYIHFDGNMMTTLLSSSVTNINHATSNSQPQTGSCHHHHQLVNGNANSNCGNNKTNMNGNSNGLSSNVLHPALLNIINEAQGMKFRGKYQHFQHTMQQSMRRKAYAKCWTGRLHDYRLAVLIFAYTQMSLLDVFFA